MELKDIKHLIKLMNDNGLARLEVEEEGRRYLLEKAAPEREIVVQAAPAPLASPVAASNQPAAPAPNPGPAPAEDTVTFNSPMVGTFFSAPTPDAESFVLPGDRVEPDTVVCLIEAMKVFNEIKAEMSGTVVEVLAENQEAVQYNQPLLLIKPS